MSALRFTLAPSPALALAIVGSHAVAAACVLAVLPGASGAMLAFAFVLLGLASARGRALLRSPLSVRSIEISGGSLTLELARGDRIAAQAGERRYVGRLMVALPFRRPRRTILILPGMLAADDFRRLRIWALWGKLPDVATAQLPA